MKNDLHARLWGAQQRWFALREQGETKHALKMRGIREGGDPNRYMRNLIFAGSTRLTYERVLKDVVEYAHREHGCRRLEDIGKREYRAFMDRAIEQGRTAKTLNLYRSALAKLGALTGRTESTAALSKKYGQKIRQLGRAGKLCGAARPHVTAEVRQAALERLASLDALAEARTGPRGYALALELQKEASLRSIEATDRFIAASLIGNGKIEILGKGGRRRQAAISEQLYERLQYHFCRSKEVALAPRRAYQVALRRAVLAVGGLATGSHAQRRTSAVELKNLKYREHLQAGETTRNARRLAVEDTVEHLGHSRTRKDLAGSYLGG